MYMLAKDFVSLLKNKEHITIFGFSKTASTSKENIFFENSYSYFFPNMHCLTTTAYICITFENINDDFSTDLELNNIMFYFSNITLVIKVYLIDLHFQVLKDKGTGLDAP